MSLHPVSFHSPFQSNNTAGAHGRSEKCFGSSSCRSTTCCIAISEDWIRRLRAATEALVEHDRQVTQSDKIDDLEPGHRADAPGLAAPMADFKRGTRLLRTPFWRRAAQSLPLAVYQRRAAELRYAEHCHLVISALVDA